MNLTNYTNINWIILCCVTRNILQMWSYYCAVSRQQENEGQSYGKRLATIQARHPQASDHWGRVDVTLPCILMSSRALMWQGVLTWLARKSHVFLPPPHVPGAEFMIVKKARSRRVPQPSSPTSLLFPIPSDAGFMFMHVKDACKRPVMVSDADLLTTISHSIKCVGLTSAAK